MLALLLGLLLTTPPIPPGCTAQETSAVCLCKQGNASACEALRQTDPKLATQLEKAAARKRAEATQQGQTAAATGQNHHPISKRIADALKDHPTLRGHYTARDPRFVTRAADKASHNGYQKWHRDVDDEVIAWLKSHEQASPKEFEQLLRSIYNRPEMRARFPDGI